MQQKQLIYTVFLCVVFSVVFSVTFSLLYAFEFLLSSGVRYLPGTVHENMRNHEMEAQNFQIKNFLKSSTSISKLSCVAYKASP